MKQSICNIVLIFIISVLVFLGIQSKTAYTQEQGLSSVTLSGQELFIQNRCVRCHTIGRGRFVGPDLSAIGDKYSKEEIVKWIENPQQIYQQIGKMPYNEGYPPMPPMSVPPDQARAIADYILSFDSSQDSAAKGSILGQVLNKTSNNPAQGVELTLTSYMGERPTDEKTIKSDEQGNFSFDNLSWDRSYGLAVNFKGAQYSTDKVVFYPNESTKILTLPIYEPTFEEADIAVVESHMIVQVTEDALSVANITLFSNEGDKIFVGGKEIDDGRKESLRISVPKSARDLNFVHGIQPEDIVQTEYGFADTTSILPGQKRVVYTYSVPLDSGTAKFDKIIDYPTGNFLFLVSDTEKTTKVTGLAASQAVEVQGQSFLKWTGSDLKPGHQIGFELKSPLANDYLKWGALAFLLLIVMVGVVYSSFAKGKSVETGNSDKRVEDLSNRRDMLIQEIARLDDDFESGQIDKKTYNNIRESKKEELKKLTRRL